MKQRLISAAVAVLICIYPLLFGGITINILMVFIGVVGVYEFVKCIKQPLNYLLLVIMETSFCVNLITYGNYFITILFVEAISLFIFAIFDENIGLDEVFGIETMSLIINYAILFIINLYAIGKGTIFFYICLASLLTDTGAYLVGRKIGKHKLNERVSPKKTIEGSIGGVIFGFVFSFAYAYFNSFMGLSLGFVIMCSILLPIISEFGDLAFSLIKRHYGIKDFGNIMPGHGGVLDRIDSVIFCVLLFAVLNSILL